LNYLFIDCDGILVLTIKEAASPQEIISVYQRIQVLEKGVVSNQDQTPLDSRLDSNQLWQETFDFLDDIIFIIDRQFNIVRANKAARLFQDSLVGEKCFKVFHNLSQPQSKCLGCKVFHSGISMTEEVQAPGSSNKWYNVITHPITDSAGFVWQVLHIYKDISRIKELEQELHELELLDPLTSVYNRKHFNGVLAREFQLATRRMADLVILVIELDELKVINEECGQQYGDYILKEFSAELAGKMRHTDICARIAGEQFAVILPDATLSEGEMIAQNIKSMAEHRIYDDSHSRQITVSIGVASLASHLPETMDDFLCYAENAMRFSKKTGRNKITVYDMEKIV
jgi:diguanylate cyclase (GGDEF)-like protein/PAS domain S-box-containing protein